MILARKARRLLTTNGFLLRLISMFLLFLLISVLFSSFQLNAECRADSCDLEATGKTYLAVRPLFTSNFPEQWVAFRDDRLHARFEGIHGTLEIVLFGSKSANPCDTARYFFPNGKQTLIVDEQINSPFYKDLLAQNFNIFTVDGDFRSYISIWPVQSVIGLGFYYKQSLWRNDDANRNLYFSVSTPIMRVKNDMNFHEDIISDGGGPNDSANTVVVANMQEAFMQSDWCFGKIGNKDMVETGLGDIEVKLAYEWLQRIPFRLESYIGIVIPTGNKPKSIFMFEPIVGNGHHWGFMYGSTGGIQLWHDKENCSGLRMEFAANSLHLFTNTQTRSFDLINRPWSRYIQLYANKEQAAYAAQLAQEGPPQSLTAPNFCTPGINLFTQCVNVKPGYSHNGMTSFVYSHGIFATEGGYGFWCRRADCVTLKYCWQDVIGIKHHLGEGNTNPVRTIDGNQFIENITPVPLDEFQQFTVTQADIDLQSAATPCMISHFVFFGIGANWDEINYPLFMNGGVSYEFSNSNNAVLSRWVVWAKSGISF